MSLDLRARRHAALGEAVRLEMVDALWLGDRTPTELAELTGLGSNLVAHHLSVLADAGLIVRRRSEGDARRRYVSLRRSAVLELAPIGRLEARKVLFVCTHNSARSLFAEALFRQRTGKTVDSAGTEPARRSHPKAVRAAAELGIDLSRAVPKSLGSVAPSHDLVVSVCDRAREMGSVLGGRQLHWSIPDPAPSNRLEGFREAFAEIAIRVESLAEAIGGD